MTPYADLSYFLILAALAFVTVLLRWRGVNLHYWIVAASAGMIALQFSSSWAALVSLGIFTLIQAGALFGFRSLCRIAPPHSPARRYGFYAAIAASLLPLVACRVIPYLAKGTLFGFLGISYVTFRSLDVVFGLNDGLIVALDIAQLSAFLFFFPPISSGPIDRYRRFAKDWAATSDRSQLLPDIDHAVQHLFRGLFYKFIIAFLIKQYWLDPAEAQPGTLGMVSYMYAYSLFLFFDFAGYSAFAVGASYLFGIHTPENFDRPFLARNIRDFWTRWHISLSTWFRDHVYMRFVIAATKGKWFAGALTASYVGYALTFGLMGLWHGFAVNFLLYGVYHAVLLIGYDLFQRWNRQRKLLADNWFGRGFSTLLTGQAVCLGFLIFSGHLPLGFPTAHPEVKAGLHAAVQGAPKKAPAKPKAGKPLPNKESEIDSRSSLEIA
ncbi:MAG TPA: D-alanyl-lipoteichoic acid biosynthesis protein DltB [Chthoniobacterales bacterium]|nr:D-alanyl-lipoteichoic acid biosynthesis protein DltB [Chthoniobacterales bacterium]